jgi:hypothetical protein
MLAMKRLDFGIKIESLQWVLFVIFSIRSRNIVVV